MITDEKLNEFSILGCRIRLKEDGSERQNALKARDLVMKEVEQTSRQAPTLKDLDVAVLAALKMANRLVEIEKDYQKDIEGLDRLVSKTLNELKEDLSQS